MIECIGAASKTDSLVPVRAMAGSPLNIGTPIIPRPGRPSRKIDSI